MLSNPRKSAGLLGLIGLEEDVNEPVRIRLAAAGDAAAAARIHASSIAEGFLPTLGVRFLACLYRRIVVHPRAFLFVAECPASAEFGTTAVGIGAGTESVGGLYRSFIVRDGLRAAAVAAPALFRSWRRVVETATYPRIAAGRAQAVPGAELLSVAVSDEIRGRGVGRLLVDAILAEFEKRGTDSVRVITSSDNVAALALYEASGFQRADRLTLHPGTMSEVLVWSGRPPEFPSGGDVVA